MIKTLFIILLIFFNIILLYLINRKKIKNLIFKSRIPKVDVSEINSIFELKKISQNLNYWFKWIYRKLFKYLLKKKF